MLAQRHLPVAIVVVVDIAAVAAVRPGSRVGALAVVVLHLAQAVALGVVLIGAAHTIFVGLGGDAVLHIVSALRDCAVLVDSLPLSMRMKSTVHPPMSISNMEGSSASRSGCVMRAVKPKGKSSTSSIVMRYFLPS